MPYKPRTTNIKLLIYTNNNAEKEFAEFDRILDKYHGGGTTKMGADPYQRDYHIWHMDVKDVELIIGRLATVKGLEKLVVLPNKLNS